MRVEDFLSREDVLTLGGDEKREVLRTLSAHAAIRLGLNSATILDALLQRETLGSTGIGDGVALPHARLADIPQTHGVFAALTSPVEFGGIDDKPVDLVFLLLLPADAPELHLKSLACVARRFRNQDLQTQLRRAPDRAALFDLLVEQ